MAREDKKKKSNEINEEGTLNFVGSSLLGTIPLLTLGPLEKTDILNVGRRTWQRNSFSELFHQQGNFCPNLNFRKGDCIR